MSTYLIPIQSALLIFPFLAAFITIPYVLHQYHRYGSLLFLRIAIVYSFIYYILNAYFMVILPLPPIEEVALYTNPYMQLLPFQTILDFIDIWKEHPQILSLLGSSLFYTTAFNFILLFPLGLYLRYYFQCSLKKTFCLCFLVSLSFELLQLTGLLGIYPRPYRIFDVDDLLVNTLGGLFGYCITPLFAHFLPTRAQLDQQSYTRGQEVSAGRRCMALAVDIVINIIITLILCLILVQVRQPLPLLDVTACWICTIMVMNLFLPVCLKGKTLGKRLVKITLINQQQQPITWYESLFHYGILHLTIISAPLYIFTYIMEVLYGTSDVYLLSGVVVFIYIVYYLIMMFQSIANLHDEEAAPFYVRFHGIHNISTIKQPDIHIDEAQESIMEENIKENKDNINDQQAAMHS